MTKKHFDGLIGFIGLGDQGGPIANALIAAGHDVIVWARRREAADLYLALGAKIAVDPAALAESCDIVALCVTDEAALRELLLGRTMLAAMRPGTVLAIHATIAPSACVDLANLACASNVQLVDAPVSGSGKAVAEGRLLLLTGGDAVAADRLRSVYAGFCNPMIHIGGVGAAMRAKLINNLRCAIDYGIADQSFMLGTNVGLSEATLQAAMVAGTGRSFAIEAITRITAEGRAGHVEKILAKDVALAIAAFGDSLPAGWAGLAANGLAALRRRTAQAV